MTDLEMDALVGRMVHDLRNPLSAITGYAEMLEEEMDLATQRRFVANIRRAATEMDVLLRAVREEARERTGSV